MGLQLIWQLNGHSTDRPSSERDDGLTTDMAKAQGVNETLKATDQMKWADDEQHQASAEEIMKEIVNSQAVTITRLMKSRIITRMMKKPSFFVTVLL